MAESNGPPVPAPSPLAGRDRELAILRDALAAALAGRGSLVLIGGEAGIGKTALAEALCAEAAAQGALVLVGRCYDLSETPPYGPWREAFERAPDDAALPALPAAVLPQGGGGEALAGQEAIVRRVREHLVARTSRQPVLLLLDDLHWADPASLDLLRVLARTLATLPLLLLATYRADEVARGQPLFALLPLLAREARAERLDLRPLDAAAIDALVRARYALPNADRARLVAYLAGRTEGNALFLGELLRTLEGEGALRRDDAEWVLGDLATIPVPALLGQVIAGRLHRLPPETERLLAVAAAIGQEVPLALWAAVAETDEDALFDHSERAAAARLLAETPDGGGVRFAHALIREALYAGTLPMRRRRLHRLAAEALIAAPAPDPDAVATHLQRAGDVRAGVWLVRAGERAERAHALLTASARYEAALALPAGWESDAAERGWLLFRLARTRRYLDPRQSLAYLEEAGRVAGGDAALAAAILQCRGLYRWFLGEVRVGLDEQIAADDALVALTADERARLNWRGHSNPSLAIATGRGALAWSLAIVGRYAEVLPRAAHIVAQSPAATRDGEESGISEAGDAYVAMMMAQALLGRPTQADDAGARARAAYRAARHRLMSWWARGNILRFVVLPYRTEHIADRRRLVLEIERELGQMDQFADVMPARFPALSLLVLEGRWVEARDVALAGQEATNPNYRWVAVGILSTLAREQGDRDGARGYVRDMFPAGPATEPGETYFAEGIALQRLAAALALDEGDLALARGWLATHDRWLAWSGAVLWRAEGALGWAAYHRAAGAINLAHQHAHQALVHATEPRQPLALLATRRMLGELDTTAGRYTDARAHLDAALALADACEAPYERALCLLAQAELHAAMRRPGEAAAPLADARATFTALGAAPALARVDALATRLAAPLAAVPAPHARPFGLSAREAEVLRLVAEGLTDAQVAERLSLSPRTIGSHLTSIYGKLGVDNRAAATRRAVEHGLA